MSELTKFTEVDREIILKMLSEAETWKRIAAVVDCNVQTLHKYILRDADFAQQCEHARVLGFEVQADSLNTILDEYPNVYEARLISDNRKWTLSKRAPSKYGDRLDVTVSQKIDIADILIQARKRMLPPRDLNNIEDAELVDNTQQLLSSSTDDRSVDATISSVEDMMK